MASSDGLEAEQRVQPLRNRMKHFLLKVEDYIPTFWPQHNDPSFFSPRHIIHQGRSYRQDEGKNSVDHLLGRLPDVKLSNELFPGAQIVSWTMSEDTTLIEHEGEVSTATRDLVDRQFISPGAKFSGIYRIVSTFKGPRRTKVVEGTAFAVGKFHVVTAGHMIWDKKYGPAQSAVLYTDKRSSTNAKGIDCVAVAVHAEWTTSHQLENDFCMVAIAQDFGPGVCFLQLGEAPQYAKAANVIGFPSDFPTSSPGKELIECQGQVRTWQTDAGVILIHNANTSPKSSGSPFCVGEKVVGVHSSFNRHTRENYAVPVDLNGNNVAQFQSVLRYMTTRYMELSGEIICLGEATHAKYRKQKIFGFGSLTVSD
ncbi:hypothetical protein F4679DRAFT_493250 [Xylaria curta]|nr:hypothetical protein F4679DRAFT_493250 [Xylaria curta]